jgi:hypothetical protein
VTAKIRIKRKSREKSPGINLRLGSSFFYAARFIDHAAANAGEVEARCVRLSIYFYARALARFSFPSFRQRGVIARRKRRAMFSHARSYKSRYTGLAGAGRSVIFGSDLKISPSE